MAKIIWQTKASLCHLISRRFKIIYTYDEVSNTVHIMDIWDTRMNPKALIRRIK